MGESESLKALGGVLQVLSPNSKHGLRFLTAAFVIIVVVVFVLAFVNPLPWLAKFELWIVILAAVALAIVSVLLFSDDTLYYDSPEKNAYAKAFQKRWPSRHIAEILHIDLSTASTIWFSEFNKLNSADSDGHVQWSKTFQRGYQCRLVYHMLKLSRRMFLIGVLLLELEALLWWGCDYRLMAEETLWSRIAFVAGAALLWLYLRLTSRINPERLTGVWRRFEEINELNIAWADKNIPQLVRHFQQLEKKPHATAEQHKKKPE
jgi:hypothetical protein